MAEQDMEALRRHWNQLYKERLPALAKARDPAQSRWPVYLDHCFGRVILDTAVGNGKPWADIIKSPAVKNMTRSQLQSAIELGEKIATGQANLVDLDNSSLEGRGKKRKADPKDNGPPAKKRPSKIAGPAISTYFVPSPSAPDANTFGGGCANHHNDAKEERDTRAEHLDMQAEVDKIQQSDLTAFRKQTLTLLCQIPRGRYSTYQAMSEYITNSSHKTCARAVGNAMRNNPFAPEVPCHRILAADGTLGGFGGHWGENGKFASKKRELLYDEGVRFDSNGKVKGPPFRGFKT